MMRARTVTIAAFAIVVTLMIIAQAQYPLTVTAKVKDMQGVERTTFRRGEVIVVETTVSMPGDYYYGAAAISYLEIIVMRYKYWMMSITLTRDSISPGESNVFGGGMGIRMSDPTGTYTIDVYVWNGFPSEMREAWTPLAEKYTISIEVTP